MVVSLQKTIQQLKAEVARYKARAHKAEQQVAKVRGERTLVPGPSWNRREPQAKTSSVRTS